MSRFVFFETPRDVVRAAAPLYAELAAMRMRLALARLMLKYNFDPAQPRVPAGSPDGGRWTDAASGGTRVAANDRGEGGIATDAIYPRSLLPMRVPPTADIDKNIAEAEKHSPSLPVLGDYPSMLVATALWFRNQVNDGGPWDYKLQGSEFENFGNFNYGATGKALGFSESILLRMAGLKQVEDRNSNSAWGVPVKDIFQALRGVGGVAPFGDDPHDQEWIKRGFLYYDVLRSKRPGRR